MSKKKTVTLTQRIPIVKPLSTDWRTFSKIAGDLTYNLINIMNEAMTMNYVHIKEKYKYERDTGEKFDMMKNYGVKTYTTVINREIKKNYEHLSLPGDLLEQSIRQSLAIFKTNSSEVLKGNASLMTFRRDQPIPVRARSLKLTEDYSVLLPFMSKETAQKHGFKGINRQSFHVQLMAKNNGKIVMDRILDGTYKMNDSSVQRDLKGKWYLLLSYTQPVKEKGLDENTIVGVDLGITKAAYLAVNNSKQNFYIDGGEVRSFSRRVRARRKSLQNQLRVCSENRRGRGKKTLLKPLEKLRSKESYFRKTINHRYSKKIVEWAVQNNAGKIQMEDLSGIGELSTFLSNWDYFDLQTKIKYKAERAGIEVKLINPEYTSQRCNECGDIREENRKSQEVFECTACGMKTNADLNAARNIATTNIENLIKDEINN